MRKYDVTLSGLKHNTASPWTVLLLPPTSKLPILPLLITLTNPQQFNNVRKIRAPAPVAASHPTFARNPCVSQPARSINHICESLLPIRIQPRIDEPERWLSCRGQRIIHQRQNPARSRIRSTRPVNLDDAPIPQSRRSGRSLRYQDTRGRICGKDHRTGRPDSKCTPQRPSATLAWGSNSRSPHRT
jgi:hypothetical protein